MWHHRVGEQVNASLSSILPFVDSSNGRRIRVRFRQRMSSYGFLRLRVSQSVKQKGAGSTITNMNEAVDLAPCVADQNQEKTSSQRIFTYDKKSEKMKIKKSRMTSDNAIFE